MHDGKTLHRTAHPKAGALGAYLQRSGTARQVRTLLLKRLWLPRILYEALPYIYMLCGIVALGSAVYSPDWTWILPWAILVGLICLHAGIALATLRFRFRQRHEDSADREQPPHA